MDEQVLMSALQTPEALWDMPSFLKHYTLHDSGLIEVRITSYHTGVIALVNWDLHWNSSVPQGYDTLAIQFKVPYSVNWNQGTWYYSTLDGATSCLVTEEEKEKMLYADSIDLKEFGRSEDEIQPSVLDDTLTRTTFHVMNLSSAEVIHNEQVCFACFDSSGNARMVPRPDLPQEFAS